MMAAFVGKIGAEPDGRGGHRLNIRGEAYGTFQPIPGRSDIELRHLSDDQVKAVLRAVLK